jgi:hypothetical protein
MLAAAVVALAPAAANATVYYGFSFTESDSIGGGTGNVTGALAVNDAQDKVIDIFGTTGIKGAIRGLVPDGTYNVDNLFSPAAPFVTSQGVGFNTSSGVIIKLEYTGSPGYYDMHTDEGGTASVGSLILTLLQPVLYNFSFTEIDSIGGGTGNVTGSFTVLESVHRIVGISGTTGIKGAIGGLVPVGTYNVDNLFSPDAPYVTSQGIGFTTAAGAIVKLEYTGSPGFYDMHTDEGGTASVGPLSVTREAVTVPEPVSLGLFMVGLASLFVTRRRAA